MAAIGRRPNTKILAEQGTAPEHVYFTDTSTSQNIQSKREIACLGTESHRIAFTLFEVFHILWLRMGKTMEAEGRSAETLRKPGLMNTF